MARDRNYQEIKEITAPSPKYRAITPHDSTDFTDGVCRSIYVGGAGNVVAVEPGDNGTAVTFIGVPAGSTLNIMAKRVNSTSTTATNMVALY